MLLIQVLLIQVSTIIIFDNLYVQNQSTTTAQALARTKTRMTTWLNSNFRGRWKEVSGPNVTLASNQWMIVMRIGKQGGNYDYHYWYRTNDGPWANKHGQTPSVLLPASDMPTTNSSSGWTLNGKTGFYNSSMQDKKARFRCGQLCTTPAALDKVGRAGLTQLLERHLSGDWGDTCESDARANEEALRSGNRIISWYQVSKELRIMIITEADRSATTILLPEEY